MQKEISWLDTDPENALTFRWLNDDEEDGTSDGEGVIVLGVVVNKLNTRVAITSYDDKTLYQYVRLWNVLSGEILWEKKHLLSNEKNLQNFISLTFSEDGRYMEHRLK